MNNAEIVQSLLNDEDIRVKYLNNGIASFNFTNKAFFNSRWNSRTLISRGLFIDINTGEVYARSYDKFFAVDERPETKLKTLVKSLKYPVCCYRKENGFLGILSCHDGEPFFASKSTNQGEFAENFKRIFYKNTSEEGRKYLYNALEQLNASAVFEVIDPINDPHIVEYSEEHVVLLNVIKNDFDYIRFWGLNEFLSKKCGIPYKSLDYVCEDEQTFLDWYQSACKETDVEGYVCEDSNGFMFKIKNDWYKYWKRMRSVVQAIASERHSIEAIKQRYRLNKNDENLFNFMLEYVPEYVDRNLKVPDIITVRNAYYNRESLL